ncbi:MAG: LytTR family DNA-binding domain-containing protein [bacterium]|nr:LytTR family DNA-binding domain-containing protein [bacterium]
MAGTSGQPSGTSGAIFEMNGDERLWLRRAWLLGAGLNSAICVVNILTLRHDKPDLGTLPPAIWESSSALVTALIFLIPAAMTVWMIRAKPQWWIAAPAHLAAALLYSILHISGFVALRKLAYLTLFHKPYVFGPLVSEFPYEFRKDLMAYGLASIIFHLALRRGGQSAPVMVAAAAPPAVFDIQDGGRLTRVPVVEILAVTAAGNYAEFTLADGRKLLMRTSLAALEKDLAPMGLVRTHRSWLINKAKVTGLRPEGSGDYAVELGELEAPLSRRFPDALAALRG